jgi:hypothetical protein
MGLAVITSCSKGNIDDETGPIFNPQTDDTSSLLAHEGTFEGEWKLSKYEKTCKGQIQVRGGVIGFDMPADYLFPRFMLDSEKKRVEYPDEPIFKSSVNMEYIGTVQLMACSLQGYSDDATYSQLNNTGGGNAEGENAYTTIGDIEFGVMVEGVEYHIVLLGIKEKPTAVYDINTGLWTIAIPIDEVKITNRKTGTPISIVFLDEEAPGRSAYLFVFKATKKL